MVQFLALISDMALILVKKDPASLSSLSKLTIWLDWQRWPARAATFYWVIFEQNQCHILTQHQKLYYPRGL